MKQLTTRQKYIYYKQLLFESYTKDIVKDEEINKLIRTKLLEAILI